jgi:single-stranded-DNA-specific exonuclease
MSLWKVYPQEDISQYKDLKLDDLISRILLNRNILPSDVPYFLESNYFFDPFKFDGIQKAIERIRKAEKTKEKVVVYGDYDVDGICATSIVWDFLYNKMHCNIAPFIPSRFVEGYGLSSSKIKELAKEGVSLIITVDCGIRDLENAKLAKNLGIDLIVTDHHLIADSLPDSFVNIHPALGYNNPEICGAAVAYKLVTALSQDTVHNTDEYLDLVALATVCDVSKLIGENRAFIKTGLEIINSKQRAGIASLLEVSKLDRVDVYHIGFVIGPKINASGRLTDPIYSLRLLATKNKKASDNLANKLDAFNIERQIMTREAVEESKFQLNDEDFFNVVYSDKWGEGIVGLIAGRLVEETGKPTIALTLNKDDVYIGSARSTERYNIVAMLDSAKDLLLKYGGHEAAAGLQIKKENIDKFKKHSNEFTKKKFKGKISEKIIKIDGEILLKDINYSLFYKLNALKPFGVGNPQPVFVTYSAMVMSAVNLGSSDKFVKIRITDKNKNIFIDTVWFNSIYTPQDIVKFSYIDIVFTINENVWNNKSELQLKVIDIKASVV